MTRHIVGTVSARDERGEAGVMSTPRGVTKVRHVRVSDQLWQALAEKAESEGSRVSEVLRELIRDYVRR